MGILQKHRQLLKRLIGVTAGLGLGVDIFGTRPFVELKHGAVYYFHQSGGGNAPNSHVQFSGWNLGLIF